jgi:hypothetical protein
VSNTPTEPLVYEHVLIDEVHRTAAGFEVVASGHSPKYGVIKLTLSGTGNPRGPRPNGLVDIFDKVRITIEAES